MTNGKIYTKTQKRKDKKTKTKIHTKRKTKNTQKAKPLFLSTVKYSGDDETQVPLGVEGIRGKSPISPKGEGLRERSS